MPLKGGGGVGEGRNQGYTIYDIHGRCSQTGGSRLLLYAFTSISL